MGAVVIFQLYVGLVATALLITLILDRRDTLRWREEVRTLAKERREDYWISFENSNKITDVTRDMQCDGDQLPSSGECPQETNE